MLTLDFLLGYQRDAFWYIKERGWMASCYGCLVPDFFFFFLNKSSLNSTFFFEDFSEGVFFFIIIIIFFLI